MRISVTQADIDTSVRGNAHYCAVSTAIGLAIPQATRITIYADCIRLTREDEGLRYVYPMAPAVAGYLIAYDAGVLVPPFDFDLEKPVTASVAGNSAKRRNTVTKTIKQRPVYTRSARVFGVKVMPKNRKSA